VEGYGRRRLWWSAGQEGCLNRAGAPSAKSYEETFSIHSGFRVPRGRTPVFIYNNGAQGRAKWSCFGSYIYHIVISYHLIMSIYTLMRCEDCVFQSSTLSTLQVVRWQGAAACRSTLWAFTCSVDIPRDGRFLHERPYPNPFCPSSYPEWE
jgi:hypothetical protein